MLQKHEDFTSKPAPSMPEKAVEPGENPCENPRNVRRVVISEESAAISLPNAPWDDEEDL